MKLCPSDFVKQALTIAKEASSQQLSEESKRQLDKGETSRKGGPEPARHKDRKRKQSETQRQ